MQDFLSWPVQFNPKYRLYLVFSIVSIQKCANICLSTNFSNFFVSFPLLLFHLRFKLLFLPSNLSLPYQPSSCWYTSLNPAEIPALLSHSNTKHNSALLFRAQAMTSLGSHIASVPHVTDCSGIHYNWRPQIKYNNLFVNYTTHKYLSSSILGFSNLPVDRWSSSIPAQLFMIL